MLHSAGSTALDVLGYGGAILRDISWAATVRQPTTLTPCIGGCSTALPRNPRHGCVYRSRPMIFVTDSDIDRPSTPRRMIRTGMGGSELVRRAVYSQAAQRVIQALRQASVLEPRPTFLVRELSGRRSAAFYSLRGAPLEVMLRHRSRDLDILTEIFVPPSVYEPPPEARRVLECHSPLRVLDLGANVGLFALMTFSRFDDVYVTSLEPDPDNASALAKTIARNALSDRWKLIQAAASNQPGVTAFRAGLQADSRVATGSEESIEVHCRDAFGLVGDYDFVKIDIEGSEWDLLSDPRFDTFPASVVALEWHAFRSSASDPRELAIERLKGAGYTIAADPPSPVDYGMMWGWRKSPSR